MVEDVNKTVEWYEEALGVTVDAKVPDEGQLVFAIVHRDDIRLMFQSRASLGDDLPDLKDVPVGASQTLYVEVADVEALRHQLDGKVKVLSDLHDTFYGTREFYFADCNGYIFGFSQGIGEQASD